MYGGRRRRARRHPDSTLGGVFVHGVVAKSAFRQQERHPMAGLARPKRRQRRRRTAPGADGAQSPCCRRGEHDLIVAIPDTAAARWSVGDRDGRFGVDVHSLELSPCEERDRSTVWRPEWKLGSFRGVQHPRVVAIEAPEPEPGSARTRPGLRLLVVWDGDEYHLS